MARTPLAAAPVWLATFLATLSIPASALAADTGGKIDFNSDVLPILAENCFACHGFDAAAREAGLRLDTQEGALDSGAIVVGDPDASELIARITSDDDDLLMPPAKSGKSLNEAQRQILTRWIAEGAQYESHWSFQPIASPQPPELPTAAHPIDRFLQQRMQRHGLTPSPLADPQTLLRRVSLDLTGIPPTPAQIDAFQQAWSRDAEQAWVQLVDRLLSSPHYGERWGRWWLDQARYADSNGYSVDSPRSIWKYRDWVIDALNADMPFDQFTIEQLAGDLLPEATLAQRVATGFHRNTQINQEGGIDREQYRIDSIVDRVATTGTVWLGLTIGCAQCHDHKFDPITQKEFYQLFAFFNNQDEPTIKAYDPDLDVDAIRERRKQAEQTIADALQQNAESLQQWEQSLSDDKKQKLSRDVQKILQVAADKRSVMQRFALYTAANQPVAAELTEAKQTYDRCTATLDAAPTTMVLQERSEPRTTSVLVKGDFTRPADPVQPGTPSILPPLPVQTDSPDRLDLARWIVSPDNPLTARVIVNRIWQQYFGLGLVTTENDFGLVGARPTHPQLLDWLAGDLQRSGWSLKALHRRIVTSHAYRQSSHIDDSLRDKDAGNRWLARQSRLRLDAEIVRDVALSASGLMASELGGPPVYPPIPEGVMSQGQVRRAWNASTGADRYRRGLYTFLYRATPPPSLSVFDAPDGYSSCTRRNRSNTPLQSLTLMNDAAFFEFSQALSQLIENEGLDHAFQRCTGRQPSDDELAVLAPLDPLTAARVLLNLDETITRE